MVNFPNKEASTIWKAQNDILEHHMSKIRNYKQDLAEQVNKINLNTINSKDISDMIEIRKIGLATYRHIEIQLNYMMGPDTKTSLEQGPESTENISEWKKQILQKIRIHWNTLFKEVINCKPPAYCGGQEKITNQS